MRPSARAPELASIDGDHDALARSHPLLDARGVDLGGRDDVEGAEMLPRRRGGARRDGERLAEERLRNLRIG
jgi:hypothetical protein